MVEVKTQEWKKKINKMLSMHSYIHIYTYKHTHSFFIGRENLNAMRPNYTETEKKNKNTEEEKKMATTMKQKIRYEISHLVYATLFHLLSYASL